METPPVTSKKSLQSSFTKTSLTPCRRVGLSRLSSSTLKRSLHMSPGQTSSLAFTPDLRSVATTDEKFVFESCEERLKVPLKLSDDLNEKAVPSAKRYLSISPSKPKLKRTLLENRSEIGACNKSDDLVLETGSRNSDINISNHSKRTKISLKVSDEPKDLVEVFTLEKMNGPTTCSTVSYNNLASSDTDEKIREKNPEMIRQLVSSIRNKQKKLEQLKVQESYAKKHNLSELRLLTEQWRTAGREALCYSMSLAKQAGYSVTLTQLMSQHGFPPLLMGYNAEDDEFN